MDEEDDESVTGGVLESDSVFFLDPQETIVKTLSIKTVVKISFLIIACTIAIKYP